MELKTKKRHAGFSYRNSLIIVGIAYLLLIYPLLYVRVISDPAQRTAADFLPFYAAGRIAITQGMSKVYDWEAQRNAESDVLNETIRQMLVSRGQPVTPQDFGAPIQMNEVNPFPHPPFIVPVLMLLARLDYVPAFVTWSVLMSILFILCAIILLRLVPQAQGRGSMDLVLWDSLILSGVLQRDQRAGYRFTVAGSVDVVVWIVTGTRPAFGTGAGIDPDPATDGGDVRIAFYF